MSKLIIKIPDFIEHDNDLEKWIHDNFELFYPSLDLDTSLYDDRAHLDKVNLIDIEIDIDSVTIHYEYEYSAYYGCKNMDSSGTSEEELIVGERKDNTLIFEQFKPIERRSTFGEL